MKTMFIMVLAMFLAGVIGCCVVTVRKKSEYSAAILRLLAAGSVAMAAYLLFLLTENRTAAMFFDGLYFASIDWMLLCMLAFVLRYTNTRSYTKFIRNLFLLAVCIDTLVLLCNVGGEKMFTLERGIHAGTGMAYWSVSFGRPFYYHLGFCYGMASLALVILLAKLVKSSRRYRKMYLYTLIPFVVVLGLNAFCHTVKYPVDFSLLLYVLLAVSICYSSLYAVPRGLLEDTLISVVEDFSNGILCFDVRGKCIYANEKACELFGVEQGGDYAALEQYDKKWREDNCGDPAESREWEETYTTAGEERFYNVGYQQLKDERGDVFGYVYRLTDRTEAIRRFREEQYLATHDRLTGLYNREYFFQKAEQILRRKPDTERYMVCTNIRNFKLINDLFGEEMGDRVLVDQASLLKFSNYEDCIQGRIGADKFAMLVSKENFNPELAVKNTGKLQYLINDSNYKIQVSIGVYRIEDPNESPQVMYDRANMAIESPQGEYNKAVVYYDSRMLEQLMHEKSVVSEFEHALEEGQFQMYLQPLVGADGELKGAEALARWKHPAQGLIQPIDFISVVEKSGLIIRLDEYIWELAARKLRDWKERGLEELSISVNVSGKDFYYVDLYKTFTELAEKYGISPDRLNIEITETVLMTDLEMHLEVLSRLQEYGFCIEIDDFGSGYSSLNMLKDIRADVLKIDVLFLRETENKERSRVILSSVIDMAKRLGISVITEGVETKEQIQMLTDMGCEMFQGFYFSQPVPVEKFEEIYLSGRP